MRFLHQFFPSDHKKPGRRRGRKSIKTRGDEGLQENKGPWERVNQREQSSYELSDWSNKHSYYLDLHQNPCVYIIASTLIFLWDSWVRARVSLWFFCLFLGAFSFSCFVQFCYDVFLTLFTVFYFVMFCCYLLETCFSYSNERQKGRGGAEGGVTTIRIYYFNK